MIIRQALRENFYRAQVGLNHPSRDSDRRRFLKFLSDG